MKTSLPTNHSTVSLALVVLIFNSVCVCARQNLRGLMHEKILKEITKGYERIIYEIQVSVSELIKRMLGLYENTEQASTLTRSNVGQDQYQ